MEYFYNVLSTLLVFSYQNKILLRGIFFLNK